jgi:hypothetical protein
MTIHPKNLCPARLTSTNTLISLSIPIWLKTVFMEVVKSEKSLRLMVHISKTLTKSLR